MNRAQKKALEMALSGRDTRERGSFRFTPGVLDRIRRVAKKRKQTVTAVLEWCVATAIPELER